METRIPRTHRRLIVERSVAAVLVAAFALAAFVLVWRERNEAALALAAERLMAGDASVEAELDQAAAAFSGPARRDVEAARRALQNRDLSQARAYLGAAISDAAQER